MRVVVALGGNALLRRGEPPTEALQRRNVELAAHCLAQIAREHELIVTYGNGPQIGLLALESEAYAEVPAYGLDILGAESQGMVGLLIEQALRNELPGRDIATLLTTVVVDECDPAFEDPTKPIGPQYPESVARQLSQERGWIVKQDGTAFRRVVASPRPQSILSLPAIRSLAEAGVLVVCAGGGGVPMVRIDNGSLEGVEAVVDKDLTSALLAAELGADRLLLLTDVSAVQCQWGTPKATDILDTTPAHLRGLDFAPGSMAPKVEAACLFVERTGHLAAIGALSDAYLMLLGARGTIIRPD